MTVKVMTRHEDTDVQEFGSKTSSDLLIQNVSRKDAGLYICTADNVHQIASTATNVVVECKQNLCETKVSNCIS